MAKKNRVRGSARAKSLGGRGKRSEKTLPQAAARERASTKKSDARSVAPIGSVAPMADFGKIWDWLGKVQEPTEFRVSCIRPDDLLVCDFIFHNLELETTGDGAPKLVRKPATTATLVVELPPQSFGEQAFLDSTGPEVTSENIEPFPDTKNVPETNAEPLGSLPAARIRMAGRSRIAFTMPADEAELAFTIEAMLDACRRWPMRLDVNAVPDPTPFKFGDFGIHDKWFQTLVSSDDWRQTTRAIVDSLGGPQTAQKWFSDAARRVAAKAMEGGGLGALQSENELRRAMDDELDVLADRFAPLRAAERREVAAAALSMTTIQAVAAHRVGTSIIERITDFPFLTIVFAPHAPGRSVTALELPYRLMLSPVPQSYWRHRTKPVERNGRTELWHTRLTGSAADTGPDTPTDVRALWSPDYGLNDIVAIANDLKPYRMSLDPLDREMLVKLMSGFDKVVSPRVPFRPHTARSGRLALSSLGALLDVEGNWDAPRPKDVSLQQWRHSATLGRDHYVRVVYSGFLLPFRHAASLVKVTERKFESLPKSDDRVAVLRQRFFIIVRQPTKHYDPANHVHDRRTFPFTDVEVLTRVTPSLRAPDEAECKLSDAVYALGVPHRACFWPMITTTNDFRFQLAAIDLSGNRVTFAMPLLFVGSEANKKAPITQIVTEYNGQTADPRRRAALGGASVCYAPNKESAEGDARLPTSEIIFTASEKASDEARFYPEIGSARVGIAAIRRLLQQPQATVSVKYPEGYKSGGFDSNNLGELFLKLEEPFPLAFGEQVKSDSLGGLATPNMAILGLSRIMGPVSARPPSDSDPDPQKVDKALKGILDNSFNPLDFFQGAKILGGVDLGTILKVATSLAGPDVPKLLSSETATSVDATFDWSTKVTDSDPLGLFVPNAGGGETALTMKGSVSTPLADPSATAFKADASITNFQVNLFGFVTVWFDQLRFTAKSGAKPDVVADLHPGDDAIAFGGPLEFVNDLRSIIPSNGFSDPPSLSVTPSGISAGYSVNIPSIPLGIFALEHLSIGASFLLPFDAKPAEVRFNFAERQRPFSLTVSLLGGGGFFAIGVGTDGVREIEAAIEFGAAISINLGVASGGVEVKAGIYFHWKTSLVELAGYVRLHGELSVLGLISASLTFNLQLAYLKENKKSVVWGEATLEVEIDVLLLSFSVSVQCRREFAGSDQDPKFIALVPDQSTWDEYCQAFATD